MRISLHRAADRWRWFLHKPDIIQADADREFGSIYRPLAPEHASMARARARDYYQIYGRMSHKDKALVRRGYLERDRMAWNGLKNSRKGRSGR